MIRSVIEFKKCSNSKAYLLTVQFLEGLSSFLRFLPATLGLVYAVPNLGTLRMVRVCILPSIMEGCKGLKFFTIS